MRRLSRLSFFAALILSGLNPLRAQAQEADLEVTLHGPDPVEAGSDYSNYNLFVRNRGGDAAANVSLSLPLPSNVVFLETNSADPDWSFTPPTVGSTGTLTGTLATLGVNDYRQFNVRVRLDTLAVAGTTLAVTATVSSDTSDPDPLNNSSSQTSTIRGTHGNLFLGKSGVTGGTPGSDIPYTLAFQNASYSQVANVVITDELPPNTTFVSLTPQPGASVWGILTPPVGGTGTITLSRALVPANGTTEYFDVVLNASPSLTNGDVITNVATVTGVLQDDDLASNLTSWSTIMNGSTPSALFLSSHPDSNPVTAGSDLTYSLSLVNYFNYPAPLDAANVVVTFPLPTGTTFVAVSAPGWTPTTPPVGQPGTVTLTRSVLTNADGLQEFQIVVHVPAALDGTTLSSHATASASNVASVFADTLAGVGVAAAVSSGVVESSVFPGVAGTGTDAFSFFTNVYNSQANDVPLTDVSLVATLPSGLEVGSAASIYSSCPGAVITANEGANTFSITGATVNVGDVCYVGGSLTATTTGHRSITSVSSSSNGGASAPAVATLLVAEKPSLTEAFGVATMAVGDTTSLTFDLGNPNATLTLHGIAFGDTLPAGLVIANPSNLASSCGGTLVAAEDTNFIGVAAVVLPPAGTCQISLDVKAIGDGVQQNTTTPITAAETGFTGPVATATVTVPMPDLTIAKSHAGDFVAGASGVYTLVVTNSGLAPTTGSVTVTDQIYYPFTPITGGGGGSGWTCSIDGGTNTFTCTRSDELLAGNSYPPLLLTVAVAPYAGLATNRASVAGGGELNTGNDFSNWDDTNVLVLPTHFGLSGPSTATSGAPFDVTVTALDAGNNVVGNYTGTVHFTTSDTGSGVAWPADYTFTLGDGGSHTFGNGFTLVTGGTSTITATDTVQPTLAGSIGVTLPGGIATTTTITSTSPDPGHVGEAITVQFSVSAEDASTPGGSVTVTASSGESCTGTLSGGVGSCAITIVDACYPDLTAHYLGGAGYTESFSAPYSIEVEPIATAVTVTGYAPDPSPQGTPITVSFAVTQAGPGSAGPIGGSVYVEVDGGDDFCIGSVTAGVGSCDLTFPTSGPGRLVNAYYSGDAHYAESESGDLFHDVKETGRFVDTTGTDSGNDCSDTANPCATVQHGVDQAQPGETVSIAGGTYTNQAGTITIDKDLVLAGDPDGATILQAAATPGTAGFRVLTIEASSQVEIYDLTIRNGQATSANGGGIASDGDLLLDGVTLTGNRADAGGSGGAVANESGAILYLHNSTISGNTASGSGGGVYSTSGVVSDHTTIANNVANADDLGGSGGGVAIDGVAPDVGFVVSASIVAGNRTGAASPVPGDCTGDSAGMLSVGYSVVSDAQCPNDVGSYDTDVLVDPSTVFTTVLGPLAKNGGPTPTHNLRAGSPAIDLVPTGCGCTGFDQRGVTRPQGSDADAGAVEYIAVARFEVVAPSTAVAGTPFAVTVNALDATDTLVTLYAGTAHFTSTDAAAALPADIALSGGTATVNATLATPGPQTITATDTGDAGVTGTSDTILVSGAAAAHFAVSAPPSAVIGTPFNVTVTALDAANHPATSYSGTVHFTSTDGTAVLPSDATLASGTGTFSVTLSTAGLQTVTATDTVDAGLSGTTGAIAVGTTRYVATSGVDTGACTNPAAPCLTVPYALSLALTGDTIVIASGTYTGPSPIAITSKTVTLAGDPAGATILSGANAHRVLDVDAPSTVAIRNLTVTNGYESTAGGGIANAGHLTLDRVTLTGNRSDANGGGLYAATGSTVTIRNSTISGNTGGIGGGIYTLDSITIDFSTITANASGALGSGGLDSTRGVGTTVILGSNILAGNTSDGNPSDCFSRSPTASGTTTSEGYNIFSPGTSNCSLGAGAVHDLEVDPTAVFTTLLGPLANNGGPTATHRLLAGSAAVNIVPSGTNACGGAPFDRDQRGAPRPQGVGCDAGAFERGPVARFQVLAPATATAGAPISVTVVALDASDNLVTTYDGFVHFTSTDGSATLPADTTLTNGTGTFSATLVTLGGQTIVAVDTADASTFGASGTITVGPGTATHFSVSTPSSATAGSAFSVTVTALDALNNTATGYAGTVHFTSNDGAATLPADSTLTSGAGTFSATLKTAGSRTITVTDTVTAGITGTSNTIAVSAAAVTHLAVSAPASATAGSAFSFTVTALDSFNNTVTGYSGTVHFTSTDGAGIVPADTTLTSGAGTFSATLKTAGSRTITVTDTVTAGITGTSNTIAVSAAAVTHLAVSAPASATAGSAFSFTVTALDSFNNTVTGYSGTVHFTSTDGAGIVPADTTLTNGVGTFGATLKTAGARTVTVTDTVASSVTGTSNTIAVGAAAATHFAVSAPASATAGVAFSVTVTALDAFNNTATGYAGTVHFTSSDGQAVLPASSTLTSGTGTFSATLKTAGGRTITATDTVSSSVNGTSNTITVGGAAATHLTVTAPASATAGASFSVTVTALDAFNNAATGYTGTVHFTKSDSGAGSAVPADYTFVAGDSGTHIFTNGVTLVSIGPRTVTATDVVTASITGTSGTITVGAAAATHYTVSAPATAGRNQAFNVTVTALDAFNNTAAGYAGTVHFTSIDGSATLPANGTLTGGVGTFNATLRTLGTQTITATDTVTGSITGTSAAITVQSIVDLSVTSSDGRVNAVAGALVKYTLVVKNAGPDAVTGAAVQNLLPGAITGATWTCAPAGGAVCTASGIGSINDVVNLPMNATATYTLIAQVGALATGSLDDTATVAVPGGIVDSAPGNNSALDSDLIVKRPALADFDGNGLTDVALYDRTTRQVRLWETIAVPAHGDTLLGTGPVGARVVGVGDYDGSGRSDLLWHNPGSGAVFLWLNETASGPSLPTAPAGARVVESGDYNGDGLSDVLWFNGSTGGVTLWLSTASAPVVVNLAPFAGWTSDWRPAASGDYDNDGRSDILWQNVMNQQTRIWFMNGGVVTADIATSATFATAGWTVAASGRYNDTDGFSDLVWYKQGQATPKVWTMFGATRLAQNDASATKTAPFDIVAAGDYDGNGQNDILWRNRATGQIDVWLMGGATGASVLTQTTIGTPATPGANWLVVPSRLSAEISDFNGDGQSDLVWQYDASGAAAIWYLNGVTTGTSAFLANPPAPTWTIGGVGDFNGDGQSDLVLYNSSGLVLIAFMNGNTVTSTQQLALSPGGNWAIRAVADFNGDGQSDLVWQYADGRIAVWFMNGTTVQSTAWIYNAPLAGWRLAGATDLTADGQPDLVWQYQDGQVAYWQMNGATLQTSGFIYNAPLGGWSVRGVADLNADGSPDIVWEYLNGAVAYWYLSGTTVLQPTGFIYNAPVAGWTIRAVR